MYDYAPKPDEGQAPAIDIVREMVLATARGTMPTFDGPQLAERLHLTDDERDGLTLFDRFAGSSPSGTELVGNVSRALVALLRGSRYLILATNRHEANPAEEAIAQALGHVVTQQILREGDVCPRARDLALNCTRDDIIPAEVRTRLQAADSDAIALRELTAAMLRDIGPGNIDPSLPDGFYGFPDGRAGEGDL